MFKKLFSKKAFQFVLNGNSSKCIATFSAKKQKILLPLQNWKREMEFNNQKRKLIPKLVYLHNPWRYMLTKFNLLKFRIFWDRNFEESEFLRGSKQAAVVLTNIIRDQDAMQIRKYTTPIGYQQITKDMMLSKNDTRLKLIRFEPEHLRRAIPMNVIRRESYGRKYCFIDMLFVGLRNTKDFDSAEESLEISNILRKLDADFNVPFEVLAVPHRILFAEIFIRFRRNYSEDQELLTQVYKVDESGMENWSVSFYKILTFDVLNYDPKL